MADEPKTGGYIMEELQNNSNVTDEVTTTSDVDTKKVETPFREFKTQKEFDDFAAYMLKKGEEKALKNAKVNDGETTFDFKDYEKRYRKDLEAQIRADIERQAKMTEAEKLAEEREKMLKEFKQERIDLNRELARSMLTKAGFDEDDMDVYLDFVNEDKDVSLGRIQRVCDTQAAKLAKQKQSILDELQAKSPNMRYENGDVNALQARYDKARVEGNMMQMSALLREAQEKGIQLN